MDRRKFIALGGSALLKANPLTAPCELQEAPLAGFPPRKGTPGRPNILMLMADQFRMDCVGAYGNTKIRTPNLDRLAREGIKFTSAYTSTPSCTPARTSLLTGMSPWGHGMLGYSNMATNPYPVEKGAAMAAAGYYTVSVGKNHYYPITNSHGYHHLISDEHCSYWFHNKAPNAPQSYEPRCDYEAWFWSQMPDKDPHAIGLGWNDRSGKPFVYPEEMHATHWTGTTATRFLQQYDRPEPFFLKVSFIRPHSPYDPPERFYRMYEGADLPKAQVGDWAARYEPRSSNRDDLWHGRLSDKEIQNSREGYYGSVSFVDEQIGHILKALEDRQMLEDTLIVFFSDHGDMLGDQNMWRKSYAYEQSSHIPMLMRLPKSMRPEPGGQTFDNPVEIRDMLPTFLDAAGVPIPESIEGRSLLHLVRTKGEDWRPWIDLEHNVTYDVSNHWSALTDGKWKYIFHAYSGEEQLFHLTDDPNELHDLAKASGHNDQLRLWRGRMIDHLSPRGEEWVKDGKLVLRKKSMPLGPNFPGYAPVEQIAGWQ
jgi:arylsulfatase